MDDMDRRGNWDKHDERVRDRRRNDGGDPPGGGWQRPRLAVIVAAILWLLYAVYERLVATGVLCDANCNIRVDLLLFFPILLLATFYAYRSYVGLPGQPRVVGMVLGVIGLIVFALLAEEAFGLAGLAGAGALAIGVYAIKSRFMTNRL
jgi:hypothetical protein